MFRSWSGSQYVEISPSLALGETAQTAYRGDRGKTAYDHSQAAHAPTTAATQSAMGLMSIADKKKLDGIAEGAQKHIAPTKAEVTGALGYTPPTKDTTYNVATQSADGLMSAADKKKLDGVEAGAQKHIAPTKTEVVNALGYTPPEKDTITPVDITLSETSTNPVRNSTVTKAINDEKNIREQAIDTLVKEVRDENKIEVTKIFSLTFTGDYFYNNRDGTQGGSWKCTDFSSLYDSIRIVLRNAAENTGNDLNFIYCASSGGVIRNSILVNDTNKESAAYKGCVNFICPGISVENCNIDMGGNQNGNICHYSTDIDLNTIFSNNIVTYHGTTTLAFDVISGNVFTQTFWTICKAMATGM